MADERIQLEIWLENGQFKVASKEVETSLANMGAGVKKAGSDAASGTSSMTSAFKGLGDAVKGFIGLQVVQYFTDWVKASIQAYGALEQNRIAFETMLGSAQKAESLLGDIRKMASQTPFETPGLIDASKQLIAFGINQYDVIQKMTNLGNAAMGQQDKFERLALAYGKTAAKGKVSMEELNMFTEAGVPILQKMADQITNGNVPALMKMVETGKIGFRDVDKALTDLTTGAGKFAGMMEKQSQTTLGLLSTLKDQVTELKIAFGEGLNPTLKGTIGTLVQVGDSTSVLKDIFKALGQATGLIITTIATLAGGLASVAVYGYKAYDALFGTKHAIDAVSSAVDKFNTKSLNKDIMNTLYGGNIFKSAAAQDAKDSQKGSMPQGGGGKQLTRLSYETDFGSFDNIQKEANERHTLLDKYRQKEIISQEEYNQQLQSIDGNLTQKRIGQYGQMASQVLSIAQSMVDQLAEVYKQQDEQEMASLDRKREAGLAFIEWQRQQALEAAGIVTQTQSQQYSKEISELQRKYTKEHNIQKKRDLQKQIQEKQQKKKEAEINEEAEKKKQAFELMMDLWKHQLAVRQFRRQQQMQIAQATISMLTGSVQAFTGAMSLGFPMGPIIGAIQAAAVLAMGGVSIGMIAAQKPPAFEKGGFIQGSPGGTTINVGEKNKSEWVLPVDDPDAMSRVRDALGFGDGGGDQVIQLVVDGEKMAEVVTKRQSRQASRIGRQVFAYR